MEKQGTLIKLKEKERQFRQDLIINAAREVFGRKSYDSVSMAEIAKAAGISKSSIYTYFKNQEELYVEIANRDIDKFIRSLNSKLKGLDTEIIETTIDHFLDYYIKNEAQWRMITHLALYGSDRNEKPYDKSEVSGRKVMNIFDKSFKEYGDVKKIRLLSHMLFSSLSGILIAYRKYPGRSREERISHMKQLGSQLADMFNSLKEKETEA